MNLKFLISHQCSNSKKKGGNKVLSIQFEQLGKRTIFTTDNKQAEQNGTK